jgi:hypothetical protein
MRSGDLSGEDGRPTADLVGSGNSQHAARGLVLWAANQIVMNGPCFD